VACVVEIGDGSRQIRGEKRGIPVETVEVEARVEVLREAAECAELDGIDAPVEDGLEVGRERDA
jgi:hypothetical protein